MAYHIEFKNNNYEAQSRPSQCQSMKKHFQYVSPWSVSTAMFVIYYFGLVSKTPAVF